MCRRTRGWTIGRPSSSWRMPPRRWSGRAEQGGRRRGSTTSCFPGDQCESRIVLGSARSANRCHPELSMEHGSRALVTLNVQCEGGGMDVSRSWVVALLLGAALHADVAAQTPEWPAVGEPATVSRAAGRWLWADLV